MILTTDKCSKCGGNICIDEYTPDEKYCLLCGKVYYLTELIRNPKVRPRAWKVVRGQVMKLE